MFRISTTKQVGKSAGVFQNTVTAVTVGGQCVQNWRVNGGAEVNSLRLIEPMIHQTNDTKIKRTIFQRLGRSYKEVYSKYKGKTETLVNKYLTA